MAWLVPGMALAMMAARVKALPAFVMALLAPALALLPLPALVLAGTRARRLELKARRRVEASGLVRGCRQLPHLQAAEAAVEA